MSQDCLALPPDCSIRRAHANDIKSIRKLVFSAKLDPTQLRWQNFWVIEREGQLIACGQLRSFSEAQELGSLVVSPPWRYQGLGTWLTQHLIEQATQPLYLECLGDRLLQFYTGLGFVQIPWSTLPRSLKVKFALSRFGKLVLRIPVHYLHYPNTP